MNNNNNNVPSERRFVFVCNLFASKSVTLLWKCVTVTVNDVVREWFFTLSCVLYTDTHRPPRFTLRKRCSLSFANFNVFDATVKWTSTMWTHCNDQLTSTE